MKTTVLMIWTFAAWMVGSLDATQADETMATTSYTLHPIGDVQKEAGKTTLVLREELTPALQGLDGFSHVWVFWWFDQNDTPQKRAVLQVHPRGNPDNPLTGVFATRSPVRPNLIALTLCRVLSVTGRVVEIDKIDAFDGTPVLDLKPYIPGPDAAESFAPAWLGRTATSQDGETVKPTGPSPRSKP